MEIVYRNDSNISRLLTNRTPMVRRKIYDFVHQTTRALISAYLYRRYVKFTWGEWGFNHSQRKDILDFMLSSGLVGAYSKGFKFTDLIKKESQLFPSADMFDVFTIKEYDIETRTKIKTGEYTEKYVNDEDSKFLKKYVKTLYGRTNAPIMTMNRVYSSDNEHGGRVYSAFQTIPALIRSEKLVIDDNNVVELDYKNNHLSIIMGCLGVKLDRNFDLYSLFDDYDLSRSMIKRAVSVMINAKRPLQAFMSADGSFNWDHGLAASFIESFYDNFPEFKSIDLGRDLGLFLQKFEGDVIMELLRIAYSKNHAILPVHDAIICSDLEKRFYFNEMSRVWNDGIERNKYEFNNRFFQRNDNKDF